MHFSSRTVSPRPSGRRSWAKLCSRSITGTGRHRSGLGLAIFVHHCKNMKNQGQGMEDDLGLPDGAFRRIDEEEDALFYEAPRLVYHIDENAVAALTDF